MSSSSTPIGQVIGSFLAALAAACPPGARVQVRAFGDDGRVVLDLVGPPGSLPREVLDEIGGPFPPSGRGLEPGTAFGVTLAWTLARRHGALIEARAESGEVVIRIVVPRLSDATTLPAARRAPGARLHVLVVDDEQLLCETVTSMLASDGHIIHAVHSAEDALAQLARTPDVDVILADLRLPGMDGEALLARIGDQWPALAHRTILTSGLLHTPKPAMRYLQKPFTKAQLVAAMDTIVQT